MRTYVETSTTHEDIFVEPCRHMWGKYLNRHWVVDKYKEPLKHDIARTTLHVKIMRSAARWRTAQNAWSQPRKVHWPSVIMICERTDTTDNTLSSQLLTNNQNDWWTLEMLALDEFGMRNNIERHNYCRRSLWQSMQMLCGPWRHRYCMRAMPSAPQDSFWPKASTHCGMQRSPWTEFGPTTHRFE
jgi:hypothetical protein